MSNSGKPEADFSETEAVETDDQGRLQVAMETLQKGGDDESIEPVDESEEE